MLHSSNISSQLYQVHLARQTEEVGKDEKDDDDNEDDGKEKEEEVTPPPHDILTAPLEDLCPATPLTKKRSKSEEEREVFDKVSKKVRSDVERCDSPKSTRLSLPRVPT